ncbi:sulfotransferase family 2 domain-containing protein [Tropicimonas isoalkanivorans]|uniref:Sulfotransferase family protein n=1 Tax=Tropicimonas isoalkanivorans TaxID=441112 RepID=A0A1I1E711_9RHOB|nr:sulfotransferase family 2 domain-containing protein [Tropicimonas isoalkanivorans]SFB81078.1 Sulfotransferase family protein [Tropicimonas isoalkanivorans]
MPILRTPKATVLFVHVPKAGGTSVEAYMRTKGPVSFHDSQTAPGLPTTPQHFHAELLDSLFAANFFDARFTVLRDPMERLISEFRWRAKVPDPKYARFGLRDLTDKGKFLIRGRKLFLNFDQWVAYVFDRYPKDPFICGNHIRPQHEFLSGNETMFRLENGLSPVFRWLDDVTDTAPSPDPERHKPATFPRPTVSAETERAVREFYADDYAMLARLATDPAPGRTTQAPNGS